MPRPARPPSFIDRDVVSVLESPEEVLTTLTLEGKRRWMYPVPSSGRYTSLRRVVGWMLIVLYFALPIIRIGGKPAILLDFIHREFALFGLVFYPTDTILLMVFLIGILLTVIIGTALLGRVWCGWGCPQTVYLEFLFRPIERLIEGSEHVRKRRDEGAWTWDTAWRKGVKYSLFLLLSLALAHTFVAYFVGWENLLIWIQQPPFENWGFFLMMTITTGLVLYDFAYFREQMCTIACPYARMQSVLIDKDSLIISYDPNRGEPRARRSKKKLKQEADGLLPAQGDCIDCGACVRTCPTGIDIREGLQMECVACTQCIDACDAIMDRIERPRGLIRYTSEHALAGTPSKVLRPRTVLYSVFLLLISAIFVLALTNRGAYDLNVGRSVGDPYTVLPDGDIANRLRFRVRNQTGATSSFSIEAVQPASASLRVVGAFPVSLAPGEMKRIETWVIVPPDAFVAGRQEGLFRLNFDDGFTETVSFPLLGPSQ